MYTSQSVPIAVTIAIGIAVAAPPGLAQVQQNFPTKPIRLMVGYTPGSQPDTLARILGQKLSEHWGRPVVVDNRPGAGGTLAANVVAKATPDGHTLLLAGFNFASSVALQLNLPYDALKDFAGVTQLGFGTQVLVVAPALGVRSVKDLIALAKAQPGKIILGTSAAGTGSHLIGERFRLAAGIKVVTVSYKGAPEAMIEALSGRTHYSIGSLTAGAPFIGDGKLLALAVFTPQRSPLFPEVPTMGETLPGFGHEAGMGLLAPAKTPPVILNQISKEVAGILNLTDVKGRMLNVGLAPAPSTPEEYSKILRAQIDTLSQLMRDVGLRGQ